MKTQGKAWPVDEESGKPIPYNVHAVPLSHNALQVMGNSSAPSKAFKDDFYSRHRLHINEGASYQNDMGHGMRSKVAVLCVQREARLRADDYFFKRHATQENNDINSRELIGGEPE